MVSTHKYTCVFGNLDMVHTKMQMFTHAQTQAYTI